MKLADFVGRRPDPDWGPTLGVRSLRDVVGKERAAEFSSWARALSQGDAAIVRAAEHLAQRHNVKANYNGDVDVAHLVTEGILRLRQDTWLPGQVSVDVEWFADETLRVRRVASYDAATDALLINPQQNYWRLSVSDRQAYLEELHQSRVLATAHPLHPVLHELAHAAQRKAGGSHLPSQFSPAEYAIAVDVSERAAHSPAEFLAEVFAGELLGRTFALPIKSLYKAYGGLQR